MIDLDDISFNKVDVNKNTVIIIKVKRGYSSRNVDSIANNLLHEFPDNRILVMDEQSTDISFYNFSETDE